MTVLAFLTERAVVKKILRAAVGAPTRSLIVERVPSP
jgi:hypothetical protein